MEISQNYNKWVEDLDVPIWFFLCEWEMFSGYLNEKVDQEEELFSEEMNYKVLVNK